MRRVVVDPVTRLEGHFKVSVDIDAGKVQRAEVAGTLYRGFEKILAGRDPRDAVFYTQRICGVCPADHAVASSLAIDAACDVQAPANGRLVRNIILAANFLQSHITHFYQLSLPDYVTGPEIAPFVPHYSGDYRLAAADNDRLMKHYFDALAVRRKCHELIAHFGGKMPHQAGIIAGGVTRIPESDRIVAARSLLAEINDFVNGAYQEDVELIAAAYSDYFNYGRGCGNLLVYGAFPEDDAGRKLLFPRGVYLNGTYEDLAVADIAEDVSHSWYTAAADGHPANTTTEVDLDRKEGYSWVKAPRYKGVPCEVGPLARLWIAGYYRNGISAMDRIKARMLEARLLTGPLKRWLADLEPGGEAAVPIEIPDEAYGAGLSEAARGALGHWLKIGRGRIERYEAVVPTTWNASPRDAKGQPGPIEAALTGLPVSDADNPQAVMRVIHSFDPCLACAVHVYKP